MTELALTKLVKRFGEVTAVRELDLTVEAGSLVALLGPSGCGKTTTLRMIAGLEEPTEGDILFDGQSVLHVPTERRNIGMVFQRYVLFPHMNVERNVSFGLRMRGMDRPEIVRRVAEVLDIVQLTGFERRFPSQLSGGQQQRVAIARTVVTDPRLLLMDEPLSNLDARLREEMRSFITGLQRRLGITTVFVTHDQLEAIELADHIGVMFDGELVQVGTPEEVFNRPRTLRVANFMGATNALTGRLREVGGDRSLFEAGGARFEIDRFPHHTAGTDVTVTVRPEHVDIVPAPAQTGANRFPARVTEAVYYGGTVTYRVAGPGITLQVSDRSTRIFEPGDEVAVAVPPERLWVFPA